jgi:hypothetical protein
LCTKGFTKLSPLHLVSKASGGEVGPPCSGITQQLLSCKQGFLILRTVEELKLRLNGAKPMVGLQRLTCFSKGWWLDGQKFHIGASYLVSSIADSGAFMVGVGHKEMQQLGLLVP